MSSTKTSIHVTLIFQTWQAFEDGSRRGFELSVHRKVNDHKRFKAQEILRRSSEYRHGGSWIEPEGIPRLLRVSTAMEHKIGSILGQRFHEIGALAESTDFEDRCRLAVAKEDGGRYCPLCLEAKTVFALDEGLGMYIERCTSCDRGSSFEPREVDL